MSSVYFPAVNPSTDQESFLSETPVAVYGVAVKDVLFPVYTVAEPGSTSIEVTLPDGMSPTPRTVTSMFPLTVGLSVDVAVTKAVPTPVAVSLTVLATVPFSISTTPALLVVNVKTSLSPTGYPDAVAVTVSPFARTTLPGAIVIDEVMPADDEGCLTVTAQVAVRP